MLDFSRVRNTPLPVKGFKETVQQACCLAHTAREAQLRSRKACVSSCRTRFRLFPSFLGDDREPISQTFIPVIASGPKQSSMRLRAHADVKLLVELTWTTT